MIKCNTCRHLCKRRDEDGTLYDWCGNILDSPDKDWERDCKYYQVATNADRIRAMSDEELAEFISNQIIDQNIGVPVESWLDWLRQEVKNGD